MCVTCLGNSLHTHNGHSSCSTPLHNLYKQNGTSINTLFLMATIDMYANVILISHTKLVCENVVISVLCYLENKCGVGKAF
jgi:hypothetical protein